MTEKYKVEITPIAESDVEEIWEYLSLNNNNAANSLILLLEEMIGTLETFPFLRSLVSENELLGTDYCHLQDRAIQGHHYEGSACGQDA